MLTDRIMSRRRRLRTFILWTGTLLCLWIAAVFVVSCLWPLWAMVPGGHFVGVHYGALEFRQLMPSGAGAWPLTVSWATVFNLPLVYPFAAVAVPTLLAWRFWPRSVKPGHCRCGYDLTGLPERRCPECGEPFEPKGD